MDSLIKPKTLLDRIEKYVNEEVEKGNLYKGSFYLIREAYYSGEIERGKASQITGYGERQARKVLSKLTEKEILISQTPKGPVRLNFPASILDKWFPNLYLDK